MFKRNRSAVGPQAIVIGWLGEFACEVQALGFEPEQDELLAIVVRTLGRCGISQAMLEGIEALLQYGMSPLDVDGSVLEEENRADVAARAAVLPIEQARLQQRIDRIEAAARGKAVCAKAGCRSRAHSLGRREREVLGRHGAMRVQLQRLQCCDPECGHRFMPAAAPAGLGPHKYTAGCASTITMLCTAMAYGKGVELLASTMGIEVSEHSAQVLTMERGEQLCALDQAAAEQYAPYDPTGLRRIHGRPADAVASDTVPDVAYLEVDGVLPMTREELPDKSKPVPGARGGKGRRYKLEGREVKNAVLYGQHDTAQEMPSRGCLLRRRYVSYLGHWSGFALLVWLAVLKLRYDEVKLLVVLGDGATWIGSLVQWLPIHEKVLHILDLYHAKHRVWEVARAIYGPHNEETAAKARWWCDLVEEGGADLAVKELRALTDLPAAAQEKVEELATYFDNNKKRMDYPAYRARGLRVTSGIVESANYHVTGARLKQQGMRWSSDGAARLAMLRADLCNGDWQSRSEQLLAA
jgi:hypothetical protein